MIKRGEIYFVKRRNELSFGSETAKSRPGIIVSNDVLNATSDVVEVVYLTTQPKKELPTHVEIDATGTRSIALCEQVDHVSTKLLGMYSVGVCSPEEMDAIDAALMCSLGIAEKIEPNDEIESNDEIATNETDEPVVTISTASYVELISNGLRACAERDAYKDMLDKIMASWGIKDDRA